MARIVFSPLVSTITGKIGNTVVQGYRGGSMAKQYTMPLSPKKIPPDPPRIT